MTNHSGNASRLQRHLESNKHVTVNESALSEKPTHQSSKSYVKDLKLKIKQQKNEIKILLDENMKKENNI